MEYNNVVGSSGFTALNSGAVTGTITIENVTQDYFDALLFAASNGLPMPLVDGIDPLRLAAGTWSFWIDEIDYNADFEGFETYGSKTVYASLRRSVRVNFHVT